MIFVLYNFKSLFTCSSFGLNVEVKLLYPPQDIKAVVDGIDGIKLSQGLALGLGDFDLIRVIGRGSYAKVLLVRLKKNEQVYAMKVVKKELVHDDEVRHFRTQRMSRMWDRDLIRLTNRPDQLQSVIMVTPGDDVIMNHFCSCLKPRCFHPFHSNEPSASQSLKVTLHTSMCFLSSKLNSMTTIDYNQWNTVMLVLISHLLPHL